MQNEFEAQVKYLETYYGRPKEVREQLGYTTSGWKAAKKNPNARVCAAVNLLYVLTKQQSMQRPAKKPAISKGGEA